jgi:hypothetical protein
MKVGEFVGKLFDLRSNVPPSAVKITLFSIPVPQIDKI